MGQAREVEVEAGEKEDEGAEEGLAAAPEEEGLRTERSRYPRRCRSC
jgi:hypothetical protein